MAEEAAPKESRAPAHTPPTITCSNSWTHLAQLSRLSVAGILSTYGQLQNKTTKSPDSYTKPNIETKQILTCLASHFVSLYFMPNHCKKESVQIAGGENQVLNVQI